MAQSTASSRRDTRVGTLLVPLLLTLGACRDTLVAPSPLSADPRMATTTTTSGCLIATASDSSLLVGDSARLSTTVLLKKRNGRPVTETPIWSSSDPATVWISGGYARALRTGSVILVAALSGCSATVPVSVTDRPPTGADTTPPPPPSTGRQLPLALAIFDSTQATPLSSNGIPLPKGWLFEPDLATTILHDGTREIARALRPLAGRYADGSLRAVLLQYQASPGTPQVQLIVGTTRTLPEAGPWPLPSGIPQAVSFPVNSAFTLATVIGGAVPTSASAFPTYESQFTTYAAKHFLAEGLQWDQANYYDRALNHFLYWMRSGVLEYWKRAVGLAVNYRTGYLEANGYNSTPHWMALEGLAWHYWLTGDERSRAAVVNTIARAVVAGYTPERLSDPAGAYIEGRIQARMLIGSMLANWLGDTSQDWGGLATRYARAIQATQKSDGSFSWPNWCGFQGNYMVGLQNDAMIKYYEGQGADTTIVSTLRRSVDYLRRAAWNPSQQAFGYMTGVCEGVGDPSPAVDLNMLIVAGPAFLGARTGQRGYIAFADSIADGAMRGAWLDGSKQFNQQYYDSYLWLWYRR